MSGSPVQVMVASGLLLLGAGSANADIGCAVPRTMSNACMSQILEFGEARRGRLDPFVTVDGTSVLGLADLRNAVGVVRPDAGFRVAILRNGEPLTVNALAGERPAAVTEPSALPGEDGLAGTDVADIPPAHPHSGEIDGVLVTAVEPGSAAARSGLRAQDLITEVNRMPVSSVDELEERLAAEASSAVALTVVRGGQRLFVVVR